MRRRPYQSSALEKIKRRFLMGYNRLLVKWPTGMGKTVLFAGLPETLELALRLAARNRHRMLVLVHREELITQAVDKIRAWNTGITIGIERGSSYAGDEQIVVASVPTLGRAGSTRLDRFSRKEFAAIVVDEAHHSVAETYMTILRYFDVWNDKDILLLGVTATPNRADGEGLGDIFSEIVDDISLLQAINEGWLVNIRGIWVSTGVSINGVQLSSDGAVSRAVDTPQRNDLIVRTWLEKANGLQTIAFCADVDHANHLAAMFVQHGIPAEAILGEDHKDDRKRKLAEHKAGKIRVLCNYGVLTEGYDDWRIRCVILARPTDSEGLYTQMVGRGTRIPEGIWNLVDAKLAAVQVEKAECMILDFVDNTSKHSLVTLPSLFGLSSKMDLKGRTITEVLAEVEEIRKRKPTFDVSTLTDASQLKAVAKQVDLLKVTYAPEIIQFSEFQWHKTGPSAYVLALTNKGRMVVYSDVLGKWHISGKVYDEDVFGLKTSLEDAIKWSDTQVRKFGGKGLISCIKREPPKSKKAWQNLPPKPNQLELAKKLRIAVPSTMTRGELSELLTAKLSQIQSRTRREMEERVERLTRRLG